MFENCFPNTLDTTVDFEILEGRPDTYIITGDIDAMWLRDSTAQVRPYLAVATDPEVGDVLVAVSRRQIRCVLLDPYACGEGDLPLLPPLGTDAAGRTRVSE